jgi:hypothetical protein
MQMVTPEDVVRRIELYYEGGALRYNGADHEGESREAAVDRERQEDLYEDHVLRHAEAPYHKGDLAEVTASGFGRNPHCGDHVRLQLRVGPSGQVEEAYFDGRGCVVS